jgi:small subunit ribosomal protein S13
MAEQELRLIVRISGRDLNGDKPIYRAITAIKGVSHRYGTVIAKIFENETGVKHDQLLGNIPEDHDKKLEEILTNPLEHGVPDWMINRRRNFSDNSVQHLVGGDLDFAVRSDIKRMNETKSYRGLRHSWGLTVRGQRTKSTGRTRGKSVGVSKATAKK